MYHIDLHRLYNRAASAYPFGLGVPSLADLFDDELYSFGHRFDASEENGVLTLTLALPGFKQTDVNVELEKGVLTVSAKKGIKDIVQSVTVGSDVDADKIDAKLEDGLLTVKLPKLEAAKPRKVVVK